MSFNLATILRESAEAAPGKPLLHIGDQAMTYAQVDETSGRVASALLARGLDPGRTVAVHLPNLPQFVLAYFGILKAGLVMLPLNPLLKSSEIAYHLRDSDAAAIVTVDLFAEEVLKGVADVGDVEVFVVRTTAGELPPGTRPFEELYRAPDTRDIAPTNAEDTAVLLYTSGTTGKPKGAQLTHFQLFMACTVGGDTFGYQPDDVSLVVLPLFHVFGLSSIFNVAVRFRGSAVLVPRFEVGTVLDELERHRCTVLGGVPTMFIALAQAGPGDRDLGALRVGVSGGASIPGDVLRQFEQAFPGVVVLEGYGLSETSALATFNRSRRRTEGALHRQADVGRRPAHPGRRRTRAPAAGPSTSVRSASAGTTS